MSDNKIQEHLNKMKLIQERILGYLNEEKNDEKSFEELIRNLDNQQIRNRQYLNQILHLLSNLIDNHHQIPDFFKKIEQIFSAFQGDIQRYFTNSFLFNLFINSKAFLFYLFKIKIIKPTKQIVKTIWTRKFRKKNYVPYFYNYCLVPKRITYFGTEDINEYTSEQFLNDCETGENNNYICKIIREDSVVEFIKYVSQTNVGLNTEINPTISESNLLLLDNTITIIDYAIFYGAIQIVKYLLLQNVPLNSHHWEFAMYSNNPEIFQLLSDNKVSFPYGNEVNLYKKAIEIHDMKLADYFYNQISDFSESDCENCIITAIKNYNFSYLADNLTDYISKADPQKKENLFKLLCSNKYLFIVESFIQNEWIKIEKSNVNELFIEAIKMESVELFKYLLKLSGIGINDRIFESVYFFEDPYGNGGCGSSDFYRYPQRIKKRNLLHAAVQNESLEIVKFLLSQPNIDVNARIFGGGGKKYGYGVGDGERSSLHIAIKNENVEIVRLLLSRKETNVNTRCINEIINNNYINFIVKEQTALCMAVKTGNIDIVNLLLERKNIKINAKSFNVFYYSFLKTDPSMWREREYETEADNEEEDSYVNEEYVEHYQRDDSDYRNMRSGGEKTALHIAIENGHTDIVASLLKHPRIDVNVRSITYEPYKMFVETPLYKAVSKNNIKVVNLLLSMDSIYINKKSSFYDVEMENSRKKSILKLEENPLEHAKKNGYNDIIEILMQKLK